MTTLPDDATAAEKRLIEDLTSPSRTHFGDGKLPDAFSDHTRIRAEVLRDILIENSQLNSKGLRLRGAWIDGPLDLQGATLVHDISLTNCHLTHPISLINAKVEGLHLSGCHLPGMSAENANFSGAFYLRGQTMVRGEVNLAGAKVRGDVQLCDATIQSQSQDAVFAPSLVVQGSLYLGNYPYSDGDTNLTCQGTLFFSSLRVDHDVFVTNCAISPAEGISPHTIFAATEEHGRDIAISLARAQIGGLLYFQDNQINRGAVNLAGAEVRRLNDEPAGPGANYPVRLDGFRYRDFSRHTDTGVEERLAWLERRPDDTPFVAQPYEQLAQVLFGMGHRSDAQTVLMRKERLLHREALSNSHGLGWLRWRLQDWIMRIFVGYGYRPMRSVYWALGLILALAFVFHMAWQAGDMTPNAAPILVSQDWVEATQSHPENPAAFWSSPGQSGQDWETFHPIAYATDLFVPLVDLGQESAWAPSTSRSPWGQTGWWLRWIAKFVGWIVTALGAAAVTGLIRRD